MTDDDRPTTADTTTAAVQNWWPGLRASRLEDGWLCPYEYQRDAVYGSFCGGDPRNFSPDYECSTPEERENHRKACEEAERAANPNLPCPSGF